MRVFLSYRRDDSAPTAAGVRDFLVRSRAVEEVFHDMRDIEVGQDFEEEIRKRLERATHVFVLVGKSWVGPTAGGASRVWDSDDMVRLEVALALGSSRKVVPILIDDARMPSAASLPPDLKKLRRLSAFALRTSYIRSDMENLLDELLGKGQKGVSRWHLAPLTAIGMAWRASAGAAVGAVLMIAAGIANRVLVTGCPDLTCTTRKLLGLATDEDAWGVLQVVAIGILALGALAPFLGRILRHYRGHAAN